MCSCNADSGPVPKKISTVLLQILLFISYLRARGGWLCIQPKRCPFSSLAPSWRKIGPECATVSIVTFQSKVIFLSFVPRSQNRRFLALFFVVKLYVHTYDTMSQFLCHCSNHCAQPKQEYFKHRVWEYAVYSSTGEAFPLWALASNCCLLSSPSSKAVKRKMRLEIFRAPAFCWKWGERKEGERLIACKSTLVACKNIWSKYVGKRPCIFAQFASMWSKVVISWKLWLMLISF